MSRNLLLLKDFEYYNVEPKYNNPQFSTFKREAHNSVTKSILKLNECIRGIAASPFSINKQRYTKTKQKPKTIYFLR